MISSEELQESARLHVTHWPLLKEISWNFMLECFTKLLHTPWSRVLLEELTGLQLVKKFPASYGTRRFITAFTSARHLDLCWASSIQSVLPHPTSCDTWVPVTTAWRVLELRLDERLPILGGGGVAAKIFKKRSRTADKGWSSSLGVGLCANNSSPWKRIFVTKYSQTKCFTKSLIN
jgi:hypothetical protein